MHMDLIFKWVFSGLPVLRPENWLFEPIHVLHSLPAQCTVY